MGLPGQLHRLLKLRCFFFFFFFINILVLKDFWFDCSNAAGFRHMEVCDTLFVLGHGCRFSDFIFSYFQKKVFASSQTFSLKLTDITV